MDVPTWHHILLTENINVARPLIWQEYHAAPRHHMLQPMVQDAPAATRTTAEQDSASSSPEAFTPLSSPPRSAEPQTANADLDLPHRTSVTTSPCLTKKRRCRISDDRSIAQQHFKEQQIANRRHTRWSLPAPTPDHPLCCNKACTISAPLTMGDGAICAATQHPMHSVCIAPIRSNQPDRYCLSCASTTGTPAYPC